MSYQHLNGLSTINSLSQDRFNSEKETGPEVIFERAEATELDNFLSEIKPALGQ